MSHTIVKELMQVTGVLVYTLDMSRIHEAGQFESRQHKMEWSRTTRAFDMSQTQLEPTEKRIIAAVLQFFKSAAVSSRHSSGTQRRAK